MRCAAVPDSGGRRRIKVDPACRAGLSPQGEPCAGCNVAQPKTVSVIFVRLTLKWHLAMCHVQNQLTGSFGLARVSLDFA